MISLAKRYTAITHAPLAPPPSVAVASVAADELSDDDLEMVVGGLERARVNDPVRLPPSTTIAGM